jgi:hypothetical protein
VALTESDPDPAAPAGAGQEGGRPEGVPLFLVALVAVVVPVVVAVGRAAGRRWEPIGDNGYFALRSRDVLTEHHPLLGTWTSASTNTPTDFNNPGPLLFDVFALPARLVDAGVGVALGAALLNVVAIVGIGLVARRRAGPVGAVAALLVTALLAWSMGSELLFDPWQPHSLLLPFLLLLFMVWALVGGDRAVLPWSVALASLILQTHLSYAILLAALGLLGAGGLAIAVAGDRRTDPAGWPATRRALVRSAAAAVLVGLLCWAQPLAEQVDRGGDGNLARLARHAGDAPETMGLRLGTRLVADVVAVPPMWVRPSFARTFVPDPVDPQGPGVAAGPSVRVAAGLLAVLGGVLGAALVGARRRGDRPGADGAVVACVALGAAWLTAVRLPLGLLGVQPHQLRWLWPVAAFVTFALLVQGVRWCSGRPGRAWRAAVGLTAATVAVAALSLPGHNPGSGPAGDTDATPTFRQLREQMAVLEDEGQLQLDLRGIRFAEPYSGAVMVELQRRGIPFVVGDEVTVRQVGEGRRPTEPVPRLLIREGDAAVAGVPGARRVALVEGLSAAEQRQLAVAREELAGHLRALGDLPLTPRGRAAVTRADLADTAERVTTRNVEALFAARSIVFLGEHRLLDLDEAWQERLALYAELQTRWDRHTVGLFVAPPDPALMP